MLDDGVLGAAAIRSRGGVTLVQHPDDALYAAMPLNAVEAGVVDHQVTAAGAGQLLMQLVDRSTEDEPVGRDANMELENRIARAKRFSTSFDTEDLGPPSGYVCPDCNGSLQSVAEGNFRNFRCQIGHAWTGEALLRARDDEVDSALWIALRSLQEKAKLARRMADNFGPGVLGERYGAVADETERAVKVLGERLMEADSETGERGAG